MLDYFLVNNPKFGRFYLLPKIHKGSIIYQGDLLYLILDITLKNIPAFLKSHLEPIAQKVKSHIKDIHGFLCKLDALTSLLEDIILCTIDVGSLH